MKRNLLIITLLFLGSFVILLLGNIIIIGEKIASLSQVAWAEYAFYTLILVVFYAVVIRPVVRVHRAPQFPALSIDGEWNTAQLVAFGHKLADNCNYIPKDKSCPELRKLHQQRLREDLERYATSKEELVQIISEELKLRIEGGELKETSGPRTEDMHSVRIIGINRRVIEWAKSVFMITAISQNGKLDTVSVLYMNYKMIEDVIVASGFRPTRQQLFRQYVNILVTSLMTFVASEVFRDMGSVAPFGSLADQSSDAASDIDVSDAAADGADVSDLRAADHVDRLAENVDIFLNDGVTRDVGKARERADADVFLLVDAHAAQLVEAVDRDELLPGALALAHLHENVAAAGYYLCLGVFEAKLHGVLNGGSLIQRFKIVHIIFPPLSIRPL